MASLFLGSIGSTKKIYEIHALTKELPFREFKTSEIADSELFKKVIQGRYELLERGHTIFCTAVNPNPKKRVELNPHDTREGTVHIVAIDSNGELYCALSVAIDIGLKDKGYDIGVPLENKWEKNGYPEGASLNPFRERYIPLNYQENRKVCPWEIAELYRHFKFLKKEESILSRLGVYIGCYHLLVREARKKSLTPSWLWVFDAIPSYFNLYRYAGAAVLRDLTIEKKPRFISPNKKSLLRKNINNSEYLSYKGEYISRSLKTLIPLNSNGRLYYRYKQVPFMDGLVDIFKIENAIVKNPLLLSCLKYEGYNIRDMIRMRVILSVLASRSFEKSNNYLAKKLNHYSHKKIGVDVWDFNEIGL